MNLFSFLLQKSEKTQLVKHQHIKCFYALKSQSIPIESENMRTKVEDKEYSCVVLFKEGFTTVWSKIF